MFDSLMCKGVKIKDTIKDCVIDFLYFVLVGTP